MLALADVQYYTKHSGVAPVKGFLQSSIQGPAFTAVKENRFHGCVEEAEFGVTGEVGVPYTGHAIQGPPCECLPHFQVLLG